MINVGESVFSLHICLGAPEKGHTEITEITEKKILFKDYFQDFR